VQPNEGDPRSDDLSREPLAGLTGAEVARRLGVSRQRVVQLANAGRIAHTRTVVGRVYDEEDVERFMRERGEAVA
jgi:excisionase family DNA binding protein